MTTMHHRTLLALMLLGLPGVARAGSTGTDELLSSVELVPPSIIFVVDLSSDMSVPCDGSGVGDSCLEDTLDAINQVVRHFDFAQYGVVGTSEDPTDDEFYEIAPVGSSYAEIAAALSSVSTWGTNTRNLAEVIESIGTNYLSQSDPLDDVDDDSDGFTGDWDETPVVYTCSQVHVIVLAKDRPADDEQVGFDYASASNGTAGEVACDSAGLSATDSQCIYDNAVAHLYNSDFGSSLSDTQRGVTHTIGLGISSGSIAESLFDNASTNTAGDGIYTTASSQTEILSGILSILNEIQAGTYTRSSPVISTDGAYMIYSFYELTGDNPLPEGHIRAYAMDNDPASTTYGEVLFEGPSTYGGAVWDGGDLLVSRPVTHAESNPDDRDGVGKRDIYTFEDNAYLLGGLSTEANNSRRIGFDYEFVQAVGGSATTLALYLDTTVSTTAPPCANDDSFDLNDDCLVDADDMQSLVDFARGLPEAEFRYLEMERGSWKLGDSPYSVPVIVTARDNAFTTDTTYQAFLADLEFQGVPDVVLQAANDGMLHAYRLEDDPDTTTEDEAGEELWAWIPGYLLLREKDEEWARGLIDLMWFGRTFLFDGSPVVEDVWIDADADGVKSADGSEWRRVVVVQQGMGGPVTLALDITDPTAPQFLWEQTNETDPTAMGYTMGRPTIFNVYDTSGTTPADHWVAMWGGGRAVPYTGDSGTEYFISAEADLYMWNVGDDAWGTQSVGYSDAGDNVKDMFPDLVSNGGSVSTGDVNYNAGGNNLEYSYISSALAVVDVDGDGDGDVAYFPVTTAYRPDDEGGGGPSDPEDPGSSWIFKAILNESAPDDLTWCEFYDPLTGTDGSNGVGARPEVFYAATTSWLGDGDLGIYWGTGTPFDRDSSGNGYFFAMYDTDPLSCTTAQPIPCNGEDGWYQLDAGEGLAAEPIVYAGVVYFTTYTPNADRCEVGSGKLYGLRFDDCSPGIDTDGDGEATSSDSAALDLGEGFPSAAVPSGPTILVGSSSDDRNGTGDLGTVIDVATDPFRGTAAIAWLEIY